VYHIQQTYAKAICFLSVAPLLPLVLSAKLAILPLPLAGGRVIEALISSTAVLSMTQAKGLVLQSYPINFNSITKPLRVSGGTRLTLLARVPVNLSSQAVLGVYCRRYRPSNRPARSRPSQRLQPQHIEAT